MDLREQEFFLLSAIDAAEDKDTLLDELAEVRYHITRSLHVSPLSKDEKELRDMLRDLFE